MSEQHTESDWRAEALASARTEIEANEFALTEVDGRIQAERDKWAAANAVLQQERKEIADRGKDAAKIVKLLDPEATPPAPSKSTGGKCRYCNKEYSRDKNLQKHEAECPEKTATSSSPPPTGRDVVPNEALRDGGGPYVCACGDESKSLSRLKSHRRTFAHWKEPQT